MKCLFTPSCFFSTRRQMRQMEQMMDSMMGDPFSMMDNFFPSFGNPRMGMLEDSGNRSRRSQNRNKACRRRTGGARRWCRESQSKRYRVSPAISYSGDEFTGAEPLAARVSVLPEIDARFASLGRRRKLHFVPSASFSKLSDLLGRARLRRHPLAW